MIDPLFDSTGFFIPEHRAPRLFPETESGRTRLWNGNLFAVELKYQHTGSFEAIYYL